MQHLLIQKKILDMIKYNNTLLVHFPKHEKYLLANKIREYGYLLLEICIAVNKKIYKKTDITNFNIKHETLRQLINISFELKYINSHKHRVCSALIDEVGCLLGAWIKFICKPTDKV